MLLVLALAVVQHLVVADELAGWLPHLSRLLVRGAVSRLPGAHRARYREEWAAELMQLDDRRLTSLVYVVGLWGGAIAMRGRLVQGHQPSSVSILHLSDLVGRLAGCVAES